MIGSFINSTARWSGLIMNATNRPAKCILSKIRYSLIFKLILMVTIFSSCHQERKRETEITFSDYRVFFDGQYKGLSTISGRFLIIGDTLRGLITGGPVTDLTTGKRPYIINSVDTGKTWSEPRLFGEELLINPAEWEKESLRLALFGPTMKGTLICSGDQFAEGEKGTGTLRDPQWRNHTLNIGRREKQSANWTYTRYQSETFLGEQFMDGWLQLPNGRLVFTIWGAKNKGENWRCGVMLSDDDGISWKYRDVGYEPDLKIRNKPEVIAGFNEQSLFLTADGKIISIIRGRDNLGRVKESPKDTWFFRAESDDNGETWSHYELTGIAGTGAASVGLSLPDGSLLHACRIPYSKDLYKLPNPEYFGLHFSRSFDEGKTWQTENFIQENPEGRPFKNYYNTMNGQFLKIKDNEWLYIFGNFDKENNDYKLLSCKLTIK